MFRRLFSEFSLRGNPAMFSSATGGDKSTRTSPSLGSCRKHLASRLSNRCQNHRTSRCREDLFVPAEIVLVARLLVLVPPCCDLPHQTRICNAVFYSRRNASVE